LVQLLGQLGVFLTLPIPWEREKTWEREVATGDRAAITKKPPGAKLFPRDRRGRALTDTGHIRPADGVRKNNTRPYTKYPYIIPPIIIRASPDGDGPHPAA
jgi:hypothetical protein